jgi:hypothetical protein
MKNLCFCILLFCSGCGIFRTSKTVEWPQLPDKYYDALDYKWPSHHGVKGLKDLYDPPTGDGTDQYVLTQGYIVTNKNDTLRGYIKIPVYADRDPDTLSQRIPFLPFNNQGAKDIQNVRTPDVNLVKIALPGSTDSVEYIPRNAVLWVLLGTKNNINICYQYYQWDTYDENGNNSGTSNSTAMILETKTGTAVKIYSKGIINFDSDKRSMAKFINKRYAQHVDKNSFKDENAMIDYILDQENKKEGNVSP